MASATFMLTLALIKVSNNFLLTVVFCICMVLGAILILSIKRYRVEKKRLNLIQKTKEQHFTLQQSIAHIGVYKDSESGTYVTAKGNEHSLDAAIYNDFMRLLTEEKIYHDPRLTRDRVVTRLGTSRKLFLKVLRQHVNMSFTDCINTYRLDEAMCLLEKTNYTNETITEEVGFGSTNTFYRQFRMKYGISPFEYKKNLYEKGDKTEIIPT